MKAYRAIIIDAKKITKHGIEVAIFMAILALVFFNMKIAGKMDFSDDVANGKSVLTESVPTILPTVETGGNVKGGVVKALKKVTAFLLTFDIDDARTILFSEIPIVKTVSRGYLATIANNASITAYNPENADLGEGEAEPWINGEGEFPIKEVDSSQGKLFGRGNKNILIRNETNYGINIDEMLEGPLTLGADGEAPMVLILHTHATESYTAEGTNVYSTDKSDRSLSVQENVVKVGEAIKNIFEERGINVIHDTTLHDHPNFNGSYSNALKTIEKYKAKYPEICVVLDVHRDAFIYDDGSKAKFVSEINGEKVAQLMFVVGTDAGGLEHPGWKENMKLAIKLQSKISKKYPTLMRGINLRKERFNGHTTNGSLIIEVGSSGNTLEEAIAGATYGAEEIADFLKSVH